MRKLLSIVAAVAASGLATPALAGDILWLDSDNTSYDDGYYGHSLTFSSGSVNVRASAWTLSSGVLRQANLGLWEHGLGVVYSGDDHHTIDNSGRRDFVLFQFDQIVELDEAGFKTGWDGINDTDATIGYDIAGLPFGSPPAWHNQPESTLNALNLYASNSSGNGNSYRDINPSNNIGDLWLIGASFNNPAEATRNWPYTKTYKDGFKLEYVTFTRPPTGGVPEPSTWAMLLVGFFGLGGALRSRRNRENPADGEALSAA